MAINSDKQVLYNMIEREISNIVSQFPILGIFGVDICFSKKHISF